MVPQLTLALVPGADPDGVEVVQNVDLGQDHGIDAVAADRVAPRGCVEPADATRPPGGRAELVADGANALAERVVELGRKRAVADPRGVRHEHPDGPGDARRRDAAAGAGAAGRRRRRRHVGVRAQVDVEHHPLRALEQDATALGQGSLDDRVDVADVGVDAFRVAEVLVEDGPLVEGLGTVELGERLVLQAQHEAELLLEKDRLLQVADAEADAPHLVLVRGPDAAPRRAQAVVAAHLLAELVEHRVVGHDHVSAFADDQVARVDPGRLMALQLLQEGAGIDDDTVPDDAQRRRVEDAAGDQVEAVLTAVGDYGVAGVVAALRADDHVDALGQQVHDLALALVAPLPAHQDGHAHRGGKPTRAGRAA